MASIERVKASDGSGNASLATVQSSRSPGASTIIVDTVAGINPNGFMGSMGTPHTFTDPITSETITVISAASAIDFSGHIDSGHIEIDTIAPGYVDDGSEIGDIVVIRPTTQWGDQVASILLVSHADDGTIKATSPKIITGINDTNGNELLKVTPTGSAVNELTLANAATGNSPTLAATGSDTNIGVKIQGKGTGTVLLNGNSLPSSSYTAGASSTTSGSYANLADAVSTAATVTIGASGLALVSISALMSVNTGSFTGWMGFAVSGATTVAATDAMAVAYQAWTTNTSDTRAATFLLTGLTPGVNVFTLQYHSNATLTATYRRIAVVPC